jgi:putative intracellular protease/amidase
MPRPGRADQRAPSGRGLPGRGKERDWLRELRGRGLGLTNVVPFLLENQLRERGGNYSKAGDFAPYVLVDGTLVTGQNPASSVPAADELIGLLRAASA